MSGYHVRQRGKSERWYVVLNNGKKPDGSRDQRWIALDPSIKKKKDAEEAARKIAVQRDNGDLPKDQQLTVGEFLDKWLATSTHLEPTSRITYTSHITNHIKPHLGTIKLCKLNGLQIQSFYADILLNRETGKKGLAPNSVRDIHSILSKSMSDARKWGLISKDPTDGVTPPKADKSARKNVLSPKDAHRLAACIAGTDLYVPIMIMLWTGIRRGELLGLTWDKVDLEGRTIMIDQALTRVRGTTRKANPKTRSGIRTIPIPDVIVQLLDEHRREQLNRRDAYGPGWIETGAVIDGGNGDFMVPSTFGSRVTRLFKRLGFVGLTAHSLRHSHASILHRAGVSLKAIQERLGHNDSKTTLSIYTHTFQDTQDEATILFEAAMKKAGNGHNDSPVQH